MLLNQPALVHKHHRLPKEATTETYMQKLPSQNPNNIHTTMYSF